MHRVLSIVALVTLLCTNTVLHGQTNQGCTYLIVDGEVSTPLKMCESDFKALPRSSVTVANSDGTQLTYTGVYLADILVKTGVPLRGDIKGVDVSKYVAGIGVDAFFALFSLPEFDNGNFLVADSVNNAPLPADAAPLELISPNEMRRNRWVKKLNFIRVGKI
jgi:Oxidoreductase molybdopterin binding domain